MTSRGPIVCITIVAEALLERRIVDDLARCGAQGWTAMVGHGHGPGHHGVSGFEGGNVRIETLVGPEAAERIWAILEQDYFPRYAVTAWEYDASVARTSRYDGTAGSD